MHRAVRIASSNLAGRACGDPPGTNSSRLFLGPAWVVGHPKDCSKSSSMSHCGQKWTDCKAVAFTCLTNNAIAAAFSGVVAYTWVWCSAAGML